MDVTLTAILHILQLGFISRHFAILQESSIPSKKYEIAEMLVLRIVFSLTSGLPLLMIKLHVYFLDIHEASWNWTLYLTTGTALLATTWALATFRRRLSGISIEALLITCPGTILKILWRAGEITTRVIALSLFASVYSFWLFFVIGLHWFAMLVCVCVHAITPLDLASNSFMYRAFYSLITSFTYIFVFINTTCENTVFRYTFYYIIFFLENTVLVTVWSVQASADGYDKHQVFMYAAAVSFIISIISMILYYKFFHIPSLKENPPTVCNSPSCMSCKLNVTNDHPPIPPRPGANGHWLNQYHTALYCGQYCKHNGQDSLLDSTSERNSILTVSSSHARLQQKLATIGDSNTDHSFSCQTARTNSSCPLDSSTSGHHSTSSPRSKTPKSRKKNKKKNDNCTKADCEKSSPKCHPAEGNISEDSGSQKQPVWLPSGDTNFANQLLTYSLKTFDNNDTADDERSSVATNVKDGNFRREISSKEITSVHKHMDNKSWSAPKRGEDRHWYSDGYSTDRTLDWSHFPVTSLQRNMYNGTATSLDTTDEDHVNCHECSHGDSEVSSIMRSIDEVSEPYSPGRRSREISPRHRTAEDNRKLHHHHHHHHNKHHHKNDQHHTHRHYRESRNTDSKSKASESSLDHSSNINNPGFKSHIPGKTRTHMLPSPASDPSHGPKSKRKGSPRRRVQGSAHPDRSSLSKVKSTNESKVNPMVHQGHLPMRPPSTDNLILQSEQIARDLLLHSSSSNKSKQQSGNVSVASTDPRFNVRVMVSDTAESPRNKCNVENDQKHSLTENRRVDCQDDNCNGKTEKKKIFGVTEKETDVDRYASSSTGGQEDLTGENEDPHSSSHSPNDLSVVSGDRSSFSPSKSSGIQSGMNENSPTSDSSCGKEEIIYENIWQVKQDNKPFKPSKSKLGIKNHAFIEDEPCSKLVVSSTSSSKIRDAWYMCSESEDSALPPEVLSSSVDGFTGSENGSDVSTEIVI